MITYENNANCEPSERIVSFGTTTDQELREQTRWEYSRPASDSVVITEYARRTGPAVAWVLAGSRFIKYDGGGKELMNTYIPEYGVGAGRPTRIRNAYNSSGLLVFNEEAQRNDPSEEWQPIRDMVMEYNPTGLITYQRNRSGKSAEGLWRFIREERRTYENERLVDEDIQLQVYDNVRERYNYPSFYTSYAYEEYCDGLVSSQTRVGERGVDPQRIEIAYANGADCLSSDLEELRMYPNPTSGYVAVEGVALQYTGLSAEILDTAGKRVRLEPSYRSGRWEFDISWANPGLYFLRVIGNDAQKTFRVLRVHDR